jgi:glycosyltransferase involved in cell wall biosynthesis
MSGLRFCMITTFYPPYHFGGDAIGIQRLSRGLVAAGHHVTVLHDVDGFETLYDGPPRKDTGEPEGLDVIPIRTGHPRLSTLLTQQTGRPALKRKAIAKVLDEGDFDVINYHNASLVGGPGLFALGDAVKLYMAHEHWLVCPSHVLWRHNRELCTGRECLRCVLNYRRPPQLWRSTGLLDREAKHVDTFIAMSEFSRAKHAEFGFAPDMEVLPYFLPDDEADFPEERGESPHERPYFLFVGRLEAIKGLDDVLPIFAADTGADLLIAGDGTYGDELRRQAAGNDRVKFLGRVPSDELHRYYRHAQALIVPSVCFETFGIILIEAFTHGIPVIARRIGPFPEIVEQSGGGELFETPAELRTAMDRIRTDRAYREGLARAGFAARRRLWSESAVIPRYLELVRQAAERGSRERVLETLARPVVPREKVVS